MIVESDLGPLLTGAPHVVRVGPDLDPGGRLDVSGKYLFPSPPQAGDLRWSAPHVAPRDGLDVVSASFGRLAHRLGAGTALVNPFLTPGDIDQLDFEGSIPDDVSKAARSIPARFYAGRGAGPQGGGAPGLVSIPPASLVDTPPLPGLLVTRPIDLTPYLGDCRKDGVSWVRVYWRLGLVERTHDWSSDYGALAGTVSASRRFHVEPGAVDGFSVLVASGAGKSFCRTKLLDPVVLCAPAKSITLAFRNDSAQRVYLLHYAILF